MAKFHSRLPKKEVDKLLYKLCLAISEIKTTQKAAEFLRDLLSYQEAEMIAKRLKIAELLINDQTYNIIRKETKASPGTIARVQEWLQISGEGYRDTIIQIKGKGPKEGIPIYDFSGLRLMKKRYPMYYWPEILLENIVKNANKREKEKMKNVLKEMDKMKEKNELFRRLRQLL
jgi:TrpR-related protein YerC/YecD